MPILTSNVFQIPRWYGCGCVMIGKCYIWTERRILYAMKTERCRYGRVLLLQMFRLIFTQMRSWKYTSMHCHKFFASIRMIWYKRQKLNIQIAVEGSLIIRTWPDAQSTRAQSPRKLTAYPRERLAEMTFRSSSRIRMASFSWTSWKWL